MNFRILPILFGILVGVQLSAQSVTSVECYQEGNNVIITYFLYSNGFTEVYCSRDGGETFSGPLLKVTGDVGRKARLGPNKVCWNVLDEVEDLVGSQICFKVSIRQKEQKLKKNKDQQLQGKRKWWQVVLGGIGQSFDWMLGKKK